MGRFELYFRSVLILLIFFLYCGDGIAQNFVEKMRVERGTQIETKELSTPFHLVKNQARNRRNDISGEQKFLTVSNHFRTSILSSRNELLRLAIPGIKKKEVILSLQEVDIFSEDFIATDSYDKVLEFNNTAKFYWGYAEGFDQSTAVVSVFKDEISAVIDLGERTYTLGKLKDQQEHILYEEEDINDKPTLSCFVDDLAEKGAYENTPADNRMPPNENNCVRMYIELDNDLVVNKGSASAAFNYFLGAFSQVAILYANENINMVLNQVKVWDEVDPYTGPSTLDYLNQFRSQVGSTFNGTLSHLVGTNGLGGIASVNVVCNKNSGHAYSGISSNYSNVPTYSWTVSVLTHELGHNLGSSHTHACVWNGNNTQIDDCGNRYLANDGRDDTNPGACYDAESEIIPAKGTIMSYCHLSTGNGIDFNLGFGPQPGDLIRDRVHNADCLTACSDCETVLQPCDDGDPCTTDDAYDSYCNCVGTPSPDNDNDGICEELDDDDSDFCIPNSCDNCTPTTVNLVTDFYGNETSWQLIAEDNTIVASGSGLSGYTTYSNTFCLDDGCYDFIISDTYGDGICCQFGQGSYSVTDADGNVLASGGQFTNSETTNFCYSNFTGCTDEDEDDICDHVDPCYDPMVMDMGEMLEAGTYNARQEIILNAGTQVPENAIIYLKAPSVKIMDDTTIPLSSQLIVTETPCED